MASSKNRWWKFVNFLIAHMIIAGCAPFPPTGGPTSRIITMTGDIEKYYPQREGTVWWYSVTDAQTGQPVTLINLANVGKTILDHGRTVDLIEIRTAQGVIDIDYQEITSEQVLLHRLVRKDAALNTFSDVRFVPPLPMLRSPLEVGRSWSETVRGGNVTHSYSYRVQAQPTVSAMGKTFQDCRRVVRTRDGILVIVYHMLSRRTRYVDLGEDIFKPRSVQAQSQRFIRQLEALGFRVTVEGREEAA